MRWVCCVCFDRYVLIAVHTHVTALCVCVCLCLWVWVCACVCECVWVCVCICVCVCLCVFALSIDCIFSFFTFFKRSSYLSICSNMPHHTLWNIWNDYYIRHEDYVTCYLGSFLITFCIWFILCHLLNILNGMLYTGYNNLHNLILERMYRNLIIL